MSASFSFPSQDKIRNKLVKAQIYFKRTCQLTMTYRIECNVHSTFTMVEAVRVKIIPVNLLYDI